MKNEKGFTIVELVIVIAVVAVLAGVLIPTFSGIVKNANVSSDTQTVRNMNVVLSSEVADGAPPAGGHELIAALKENGFSEFRPQTKFYTFYWIKNQNVIVLSNEDGDPVFPEKYAEERYDPDTWINLEAAVGMPPLPTAPSEDLENPREFILSVTVSGGPQLAFDVPATVTEGEPLKLQFVVPEEMQIRYQIKNVTALMEDGEETHRIDVTEADDYDVNDYPGGFSIFEIPFTVDIPCVTGNIQIRVTVKEFCCVTVKGNNAEHLKTAEWRMWFEKGMSLSIPSFMLEREVLKEGYGITSAIVYSDEHNFGEVYDKEDGYIHSRDVNISRDLTVEIQTVWKSYRVQLTVKDQHGNTIFDQTPTVSYDTVIKDVAYTFDLSEALAGKEFELLYSPNMTPAVNNEKRKPIYNFDTDNCTVKITNINNDLNLTYFLNVKESTSQE